GVDQLGGVAQLVGANADVEAQSLLAQQANAREESLVEAVARRRARAVEHLPQTLDLRALLEPGEIRFEIPRCRPARDHDSEHRPLTTSAEVDDVFRLLHLL